MASLVLRTNLLVTLLILVNAADSITTENEVTRTLKHSMPALFDEHLLRSSEDRPEKTTEEEDEDVKTTQPKESKSLEDTEQRNAFTTTDQALTTIEYQNGGSNDEEEEYEEKKSVETTTHSDVTDTTSLDTDQSTDNMDVMTKQDVDGNIVVDTEKGRAKVCFCMSLALSMVGEWIAGSILNGLVNMMKVI